jgi:hypothetical protein
LESQIYHLEFIQSAINSFASPVSLTLGSERVTEDILPCCGASNRNPDYSEMLLASAAIGWNVGRFAEGMDLFNMAVEKDPRLLDEKYLKVRL